ESTKGSSHLVSHGTVRETLASYGSYGSIVFKLVSFLIDSNSLDPFTPFAPPSLQRFLRYYKVICPWILLWYSGLEFFLLFRLLPLHQDSGSHVPCESLC